MAEQAILSRGGDTRNQLLETGLRLFAQFGYEAVTTRQLAAEAGVNIAAIAYHFGGKRELYRAVLQQLIDDTEALFGPALANLRDGIDRANGDRKQLAGLASNLIGRLTRLFISEEFMKWRAPMVLREFSMPSEDFDILYQGRIGPLHREVTRLAAAALQISEESPEAAIRAHTVMGQVFVFEIARHILWRRLEWEGYSEDRINLVANTAAKSAVASLGLPQPDQGES